MSEETFRIAYGFLHFKNLPEEFKHLEGMSIYYSKDCKLKEGDPCIGRIESVYVEGNTIKERIVLDDEHEVFLSGEEK